MRCGMRFALRLMVCIVCAAWFITLPGCHRDEHKKVQVREEQREGEVHERETGEMIVE
jgi:hypothetical protein